MISSETNCGGVWLDSQEYTQLKAAVNHNPPHAEAVQNNQLAKLWAEANEPIEDPEVSAANTKDLRERGMVPLGDAPRGRGTSPHLAKTRKPRAKKTPTTDS